MQLLIIGADSQVGQALAPLVEQAGFGYRLLATDDKGYLSADSVAQAIVEQRQAGSDIDYLINTSLYPSYLHAESDQTVVEKVHTNLLMDLSQICHHEDIPLLQLSNFYLFDGQKEGLYTEDDELHPLGCYGRTLLEGERTIRAYCPEHIILRTGAVFSQWGDNFLIDIIRSVMAGESLRVPQALKGCPTPAADIARVIIALLQQLHCDSNTWGVFHYCSSDATESLDFAEAVVAVLSQTLGDSLQRTLSADAVTAVPLSDTVQSSLYPLNSVMSCRKVLDTYGIKQRPWRPGLTAAIQAVFSDNVGVLPNTQ